MKIIHKLYEYDSFSTEWKKKSVVITENWVRSKALVKEADDLGLKCKVIVQK